MKVRQITEKDYAKIKSLESKFYKGSCKFTEDLQDTSDYEAPFREIMNIINGAKQIDKMNKKG